jgi:hypothetical protein
MRYTKSQECIRNVVCTPLKYTPTTLLVTSECKLRLKTGKANLCRSLDRKYFILSSKRLLNVPDLSPSVFNCPTKEGNHLFSAKTLLMA